jgi:hypothetical protein
MKRVAQKDEQGCGVACVAMLAHVSYDEARERMFPGKKGGLTTDEMIRRALRYYGIGLGRRFSLRGKGYSDLQKDGLLRSSISWNDAKWFHWMVWDARSQAILDPSASRISSRNTRLIAYFPISH